MADSPHNAYVIRKSDKAGKTRGKEWLRIGVAWPLKDGKGFDLDCVA